MLLLFIIITDLISSSQPKSTQLKSSQVDFNE